MSRFLSRVLSAALISVSLAACGGGSGGGTAATVAPIVAPVLPASVSGDMLALSPSRGWNYQTQGTSSPVTTSLYSDPATIVSGTTTVLVAEGKLGTVATALDGTGTILGGLGITGTAGTGFNVSTAISPSFSGLVPGSPLLVPGTLTLGQVLTPYTGVTATVTMVGAVPGASGCPTPANGATVAYAVNGQTYKLSFVPGCGITDFVSTNGTESRLVSVGSYPQLGQLAIARRAQSLTLLDTFKSLVHLLDH